MIQKSNIALIFLVIILLAAFSTLALTPFGAIMLSVGLGFSLLGYGLLITFYRRFPKPMRTFAWLFLLLFVQSVFATKYVYGQSVREGLVASSALLSVGIGLLVYFVMLRYDIGLERLFRTTRVMAWVYFFALAVLFVSGTTFTNAEEEVFGVESMRKGLINFVAFYYLLRFFQEGQWRFLFFNILLFSANEWQDFQRIMFILFLLCFAVALYQFRRRSTGARLLIGIFILLPILSVVLPTTDFGQQALEKFNQAFELFESDKEQFTDSSVMARIKETEYAVEGIQKYPITGTGRMKRTNIETYTGLSYFFVNDIGIIGIMFCFGVLGIVILLWQFGYWWVNYIKGRFREFPITSGAKLYLLLIFLHTFFSGLTIFTPAEFMLMLAFIELEKFEHSTHE